ncbi:MAG TPA: hypothetical protein VKG26_08000 [Bacteroidia bacterium]|nr:hypothetical protein [Bacteroidia bacterium]
MKKTFYTIATALLVIIGGTACKKETATAGGGPSTGSNIPTTVGYTLSANGDISGTYNGYFLEALFSPYTTAGCVFFSTPQPLKVSTNSSPVTNCSVTSVYCNGTKLQFDPTGISYNDTTNALIFPPATWSVTGNSLMPSFTYTYTGALPVFTNTAALPATINRSQDLVISLAGVTGYDQASLSVNDYAGHSVSAFVSNTASSITIVKDSLAKLTPTTNQNYGYIDIELIKYNPQAIGGKTFLFIKLFDYEKTNITLQ